MLLQNKGKRLRNKRKGGDVCVVCTVLQAIYSMESSRRPSSTLLCTRGSYSSTRLDEKKQTKRGTITREMIVYFDNDQ